MKKINHFVKSYLKNLKEKRDERKQMEIIQAVCERNPSMRKEIEAIMLRN